MKKKLLTSADLAKAPPASIDLDTFILTPSARVTAERLGIPLHKGGEPLDARAAGSSKTGGPGAGDYTLVRPEFTPSAAVPRFGNPTYAPLEPIRGSKAWREAGGAQHEDVRKLVMDRLGPGATPQAIEAGVREILARLAGSSPFEPSPPGASSTTPLLRQGAGAVSYRGEAGEVHIVLPPTTKTYVIKVQNGFAKICDVVE